LPEQISAYTEEQAKWYQTSTGHMLQVQAQAIAAGEINVSTESATVQRAIQSMDPVPVARPIVQDLHPRIQDLDNLFQGDHGQLQAIAEEVSQDAGQPSGSPGAGVATWLGDAPTEPNGHAAPSGQAAPNGEGHQATEQMPVPTGSPTSGAPPRWRQAAAAAVERIFA
jgi:hypothetical protein